MEEFPTLDNGRSQKKEAEELLSREQSKVEYDQYFIQIESTEDIDELSSIKDELSGKINNKGVNSEKTRMSFYDIVFLEKKIHEKIIDLESK